MKRAGSPTTTGMEEVAEEAVELLEAKRLKGEEEEEEEVCMEEGVVYEEEVLEALQQPPPQYQNLIIQHMDIDQPLVVLKRLLESRLQCSLADHQFFLQDKYDLVAEKSLVEQGVQGTGNVQINLEVKSQPGVTPRINIVDILKPAEEEPTLETMPVQQINPSATKVVLPYTDESENVTRWIVDQNFRREQDRLKIPYDPHQWSQVHVRHWVQWAVAEFGLEGVDVDSVQLTGQELCELKHPDFVRYFPHDPNDVFWTHLELLRKCKFVAVMQQPAPHAITTITVSTTDEGRVKVSKQRPRSPRITGEDRLSPGNRTGNNGQIQLWQFLLELLTDHECREWIAWVGEDGEFKLNNPEMVAQMWGRRKNKPTMNYEKLSRALRYYYDGDMIAKVHGKRFVYKFVCDLKMLLGYTAGELSRQVAECADRKLQKSILQQRGSGSKRVVNQNTQTIG